MLEGDLSHLLTGGILFICRCFEPSYPCSGTIPICPIPAGVSFKSVNGLCCKGSSECNHTPDRSMFHLPFTLLGESSILLSLRGDLSHLSMLCWGNCLICKCFVGGSVSSVHAFLEDLHICPCHAFLEDLSHLSVFCWGICLVCPCSVGEGGRGDLSGAGRICLICSMLRGGRIATKPRKKKLWQGGTNWKQGFFFCYKIKRKKFKFNVAKNNKKQCV